MSNRHPNAYPKNPGLNRDSTIPDDNTFVKTLFNAKTRMEEEYRDGPIEFRPVIYRSQIDAMQGFWTDEKFGVIRDWIENAWDVVEDRTPETINNTQKVWDEIDRQLWESERARATFYNFAPKRGMKTWLGSQWHERQRERLQRSNRVAQDISVPGVRGIGYSADQAFIDEPYYTAEGQSRSSYWEYLEEGNAALTEWLQRRSVCYRAPSCSVA